MTNPAIKEMVVRPAIRYSVGGGGRGRRNARSREGVEQRAAGAAKQAQQRLGVGTATYWILCSRRARTVGEWIRRRVERV